MYQTIFVTPLYNLLVLLFKVFPWADAGIIVAILTVIVRLIIYPLSKKAVVTQVKMAEIGPQVNEIRDKYKDKPEEVAKRTLALYREKGVNPFSGIFVILIQLPILLAIYKIFLHAGFPAVDLSLLYSFIPAPVHIDTTFLGLFDITKPNIILAIFAAAVTYLQIKISTSSMQAPKGNSFGDNLARSMQTQMKFFIPVMVFFISYKISGVIALYLAVTSLFTIIQDLYIRKKLAPRT